MKAYEDNFFNNLGKQLENDKIERINAVNLEIDKLDKIINEVELTEELKDMVNYYNRTSFSYKCDFYSKLISVGRLVDENKIDKKIAQEWVDNISEIAYDLLCRDLYNAIDGIYEDLDDNYDCFDDFMELSYVLKAFSFKDDDFEVCYNNIAHRFSKLMILN
jgi:hypothetical protein